MCHIGPTYTMAASVILAEYARYKVVPFGEIESNSSVYVQHQPPSTTPTLTPTLRPAWP